MQNFLTKLWNDESGQDLVEYALLLAFIAILAIGAITLLGENIRDFFNDTAAQIPGAEEGDGGTGTP